MVDDVLLKGVTNLIDKIHMHVGIIRVDLAATLVDGHEHGLDATRGLRHQRSSTGWSDCQAGDVAATMLHHVLIEFRISILQAENKRIVLLTFSVIDAERTTLLSHLHRRTISVDG